MSTVTLEPLTPPPHTSAWAQAKIDEAPVATGPWATIDTQTLSPADTDPSNPQSRTLTTTLATQTNGWYRVTWIDASTGAAGPTDPQQNTAGENPGGRPTVYEVASLIRARTKVRGGNEAGTFTAQTRPTAGEVEEMIDQALDEIGGKVQPVDQTLEPGQPLGPDSDYERRYRRTVAMYAAILIELSYFPEQVKSGMSPVDTYQKLYESRIRALIAEGETGRPQGEGAGGSGGGDAPADAAWSFPDATPGALVGWYSRW